MKTPLSPSLIALAALFASTAFAQAIHPTNPGSYVEYYGKRKVGGTLLVGIRWSAQTGKFDPKGIRLHVDPSLRGQTVCVAIASRDALYFAENLFTIPSNAPGESYFDSPTNYGKDLSQYDVADIAVTVRLVGKCGSAADGEFLPVWVRPAGQSGVADVRHVSIDVNADPNRLTVQLSRQGTPDINGLCSAASGNRIAFTSTCVFNDALPSSGLYTLTVTVRERTRPLPNVFKLRVPGA